MRHFSKKFSSGIVLLPVVVALSFVMFLIVLGMAMGGFAETESSQLVEDSSHAFFAAEAGVVDAISRLKRDPSFNTTGYPLRVKDALAEVRVENTTFQAGGAKIFSTGSFREATRHIEVSVKIALYGKVTIESWHEISSSDHRP